MDYLKIFIINKYENEFNLLEFHPLSFIIDAHKHSHTNTLMIKVDEIGIREFRNEWQKASISILYTHGIVINAYEKFFKQYDLTVQQYNALRILRASFPKPVSTSFLRDKMLDKMSDASRLVSRLALKELVEVKQNASDKRLVNILISDKGLKVLEVIDGGLHQLDDKYSGLTEEEATKLVELLYKVRKSFSDNEGKTEPKS